MPATLIICIEEMDFLFYALVAVAGIIALWFIFKLIGGCLIRLFVTLAVLAAVGFVIWLILTR